MFGTKAGQCHTAMETVTCMFNPNSEAEAYEPAAGSPDASHRCISFNLLISSSLDASTWSKEGHNSGGQSVVSVDVKYMGNFRPPLKYTLSEVVEAAS